MRHHGFKEKIPHLLSAMTLVAMAATTVNSRVDGSSKQLLQRSLDPTPPSQAAEYNTLTLDRSMSSLGASVALFDTKQGADAWLKDRSGTEWSELEGTRLSSAGFSPMFFKASSCGSVSDGESVTRVRYATSSSASTCTSQVQTSTCSSGSMSPYTGTYTYTSCTESRTRYSQSSTTCPTACSPQNQTRTCTGGTCGAWSGTYTYASCTQNETSQSSARRINQQTSYKYCCTQGYFTCWRYCTGYSTTCVNSGTKTRYCTVNSNTTPGSWTSWSPADQC